jgi:glycosyltransferase involved in cell wall biosynthesis
VLPVIAGRGATLLSLAHEHAPFPLLKQITVAHDLTQLKGYGGARRLPERLRDAVWVAGLRRSRHIIAISQATKTDLVETLGLPAEGVHVVYEGFNPDIFRPISDGTTPGATFLLYAGTLAPNKNIETLLDAFVTARRSVDLKLKLVGKQDPQRVLSLLGRVPPHLRDEIDFAGFVNDRELASLMQRCTAFVFPSLNEGFGLAAVEAMACGAPMISSDAGSLAEVVAEGGLLLPPRDASRWSDAIVAVARDPQRRADLRARALARSAAFSWPQAASAYLALIDERRQTLRSRPLP